MVKFHGGDTGQEETQLGVFPPNFPVKYLATANGEVLFSPRRTILAVGENLRGKPPIAFRKRSAMTFSQGRNAIGRPPQIYPSNISPRRRTILAVGENMDGTPPIAFLPGEALSQAVLLHFTPSAHEDSP